MSNYGFGNLVTYRLEHIMDIKQNIIELCDEMMTFWQNLKEKMESISKEDKATVVCEWSNYFIDNSHTIGKLSEVKMNVDQIKEKMVMIQEFKSMCHTKK